MPLSSRNIIHGRAAAAKSILSLLGQIENPRKSLRMEYGSECVTPV
jgi:hypothetical protein